MLAKKSMLFITTMALVAFMGMGTTMAQPEEGARPALSAPPETARPAAAQPEAAEESPGEKIEVPEGDDAAEKKSKKSAEKEPAHDPTGFTVSTLNGGAGLFHIHTANVGRYLDLRFGIHFQYFTQKSFIVDNWSGCGANCPDETNSRTQGAVTVGFTPYKYLEVFAALYSSANRNERDRKSVV